MLLRSLQSREHHTLGLSQNYSPRDHLCTPLEFSCFSSQATTPPFFPTDCPLAIENFHHCPDNQIERAPPHPPLAKTKKTPCWRQRWQWWWQQQLGTTTTSEAMRAPVGSTAIATVASTLDAWSSGEARRLE